MDVICQHHYGHLNGAVEAVLDENPDLAREAQPYRAGLIIRLPVLLAQEVEEVTFWD